MSDCFRKITTRLRTRAGVRRIMVTLVAGGVLLLPASLTAQVKDEAVADEIKAILIDMWDAVEQEDLDRYASHLHPDFTSFGESDPYLNEGKEFELRSYADWFTRVEGVHTEMHQPEVTVMGDTAWMTYYWTDAGYRADGTRYTSQGKSTRIFVRVDGRWLCIHGHYTAT